MELSAYFNNINSSETVPMFRIHSPMVKSNYYSNCIIISRTKWFPLGEWKERVVGFGLEIVTIYRHCIEDRIVCIFLHFSWISFNFDIFLFAN